MLVLDRLKNAYRTGGIAEIVRKIVYHKIYTVNGNRIRRIIDAKSPEYALYSEKDRNFIVVVSLTTYPERFESLEPCLHSLTLQKEKPDKIIVYLGSDAGNCELPSNLKEYEKYGIEFRIDEMHNYRSHKKYYYAMQEFPDAVVVTADDDIVYPETWLHSLLDSYRRYPEAISARRVHLMRQDKNGNLMPYNMFFDQYRKLKEPSHALIATGNAGILYPPNCLAQGVFDSEAFSEVCFEADDIWLKCMALLKGTKVVWVPNWEVDLPEVERNGKTGLSDTNVWDNKNDRYLKNMMNKYKIDTGDFFQK